ncbi:hypothetical protein KBD33_03585 [Candidatus Gracilibacteria bacterium]|nr:hypothetical protein [Candidatus Gracilibacteria bacterium]
MFTISVGDILSSYTGDSKEFSFSGDVFDGFFEDLAFVAPLQFDIQLLALEDGIEVLFRKFHTEVRYEGMRHIVEIPHFARTWKTQVDPLLDGDDVRGIDTRSMTIDLGPVIREEIIMACHEL